MYPLQSDKGSRTQMSVNKMVTDAVTQTNLNVVADAPAMAVGSIYQTAAHSYGLMLENAVSNQNLQNMNAQAFMTQGLLQVYSTDTVSNAINIVQMFKAMNG